MRPSSFDHSSLGVPCAAPWAAFSAPFFRMLLGFAGSAARALGARVAAAATSTSSISFVRFVSAFALSACDAGNSASGTSAVRGASLPLDAMFGVPICRDRLRLCWASTRCSASSESKGQFLRVARI